LFVVLDLFAMDCFPFVFLLLLPPPPKKNKHPKHVNCRKSKSYMHPRGAVMGVPKPYFICFLSINGKKIPLQNGKKTHKLSNTSTGSTTQPSQPKP
jgi:hypothetical protein